MLLGKSSLHNVKPLNRAIFEKNWSYCQKAYLTFWEHHIFRLNIVLCFFNSIEYINNVFLQIYSFAIICNVLYCIVMVILNANWIYFSIGSHQRSRHLRIDISPISQLLRYMTDPLVRCQYCALTIRSICYKEYENGASNFFPQFTQNPSRSILVSNNL